MATVSPQQIYGYLLQRGVSPASAAGILSNIEHESSFNPAVVGDRGKSGGLFQHHAGRWDNLKRFAASTGRSWADWTAQVDFALGEAQQMGINLRASDPAQAAREWTIRFERPSNAQFRAGQRAARAGYYLGGGGGAVPPPGMGTPPAPMAPGIPPPGLGAALGYYNTLYQGFDRQVGLNAAQTQFNVDYQRRQQQFANQMAGFQQQGLDLEREQLGLENRYQNDLALLNRGLTEKQQQLNEREWRQIAADHAELQKLNQQRLGVAQRGAKTRSQIISDQRRAAEKYAQLQGRLDTDIAKAEKRWIGQQKGFNRRDLNLARQAIKNVVTTEAARFNEIRRLTGAERDIAKQKRTFIAKGAREAYAQATAIARRRFGDVARQAQFVEDEQRREEISEAVTKGARLAPGTAEDLTAFERQRALTTQQARTDRAAAFGEAQVSRDDVLRMSQNQLRSELEDIDQAYRQGRISFQDAQRQAHNARGRARLTFEQNAGQLANQLRQAGFDLRGARLANNRQLTAARLAARGDRLANRQQLAGARLGYRQTRQNLNNQRALANLAFQGNQANLAAQAEQAARTQAYNNALYGVNLAGAQNRGGSIAAQLAAQQAANQYGINQALIGGAQFMSGIDQQRAGVQQQEFATIGEYAGQPPAGYSYPTQKPRSSYSYTPSPTASGVYVPPGGSSSYSSPTTSRSRRTYSVTPR